MSVTANGRCSFPYANEPSCDRTIAQTGGSTYTAFNAGWFVAALVLFVVHVIQFIRLCRIRGWTRKQWTTSYLHQIYAISLFNTFDLVIRACDPMNWDNRIAFPMYRLLMDMGTWSAYSLVMLCVCSWVRIMRQISGKSVRPVQFGERVTLCISLCFFFSISMSFSYSSQPYVVAAVDYVVCVLYSCILFTIVWVHGLGVYCHLSRFSPSSVRDPRSAPSSPQPSVPPSTSRTPAKREVSAQRKKNKIVIILKLMLVMTICIGIAAILQLYNGYLSLRDKYARLTNPDPYPEWRFGPLLQLSGFTIIHGAASTACLVFFRKFGTDSSRDLSSRDAKSSSDQPPTSQGTKSTAKPAAVPVEQGVEQGVGQGVGVGASSPPVTTKAHTPRGMGKPSRIIHGGGSGAIEIAIDQPMRDSSQLASDSQLISPAGLRASVETRASVEQDMDLARTSPSITTMTMAAKSRPVNGSLQQQHPSNSPVLHPYPHPLARAPSSSSRHPFQASPQASSFERHTLELDGISVEMAGRGGGGREDRTNAWRRPAQNHM